MQIVMQEVIAMFEIIWPERRYVSIEQIRLWYGDAVANGEIDEDILPDCDECADAMARELHYLGTITLGRSSR